MKRTISEQNLNNIISESIARHLYEFNEMGNFSTFETKDDEKENGNKEDGRESDMKGETENEKEKRDQVEDFFEKPGVNNAPYAYELYGVEPEKGKDTNAMKNARSQFEKDLNHAKNANGYPYSFTSQQVNQLQSMISSNQLAEAITNAIRKNLK